jgi:hypothetical protein
MASSWAALGPHPGYFTEDLAAADPEVHEVSALCRDFPIYPDLA